MAVTVFGYLILISIDFHDVNRPFYSCLLSDLTFVS